MPLNLDIPSPVLPYDRLTNAQRLNYYQGEEELAIRRGAGQADYSSANLKNLNDTTDKMKVPLGNQYYNDVTNREAQKVYNDLIGSVATMDKASFDMLLHQQTDNLLKWHDQFKTDFDFTQKYVDDTLKTNPNLDTTKTKEVARAGLEGKYFEQGQNGDITRKHPDAVVNNQNPVSMLDDPRMQGLLAVGGLDVLKKHIQSGKFQNADFSKYASDKGFVNSNSYDIGFNPDLKELSHDEHGRPVLKMKTEQFDLGNGVNLKMLPKATYDAYMSDPQVSSAINKMWIPQSLSIEGNLAKQGMQVDAKTDEMLKRDFVRKVIEDNGLDLSYIQQKEKTVVPKPPNISVSVNGGGVSVYPVYGEVDNALSNMEQGGNKWLSVSVLKPIPKNIIVDQANKNLAANEDKYSAAELQVIRGDDGTLRIFNKKGDFVDYVPQTDADLAGSKNQKERQQILGNKPTLQKSPAPSTNEFDQYKRH